MEKFEFKVAFQLAPNTPAEESVCTKTKLVDCINEALTKSPVCVISKVNCYE